MLSHILIEAVEALVLHTTLESRETKEGSSLKKVLSVSAVAHREAGKRLESEEVANLEKKLSSFIPIEDAPCITDATVVA